MIFYKQPVVFSLNCSRLKAEILLYAQLDFIRIMPSW